MTSRARKISLLLLGVFAAGCGFGNYSNEDLEFMNAFPDKEQIQPNFVGGALVTANDAEMARFTYGVTVGLNSVVAGIVNMVDAIRSLPPTSRTSSSRTWGPANSDHPGWQSRMIIWRDAGDPAQLDYEIAFHQAGAADTEWPTFLTGWFRAGQTARRGRGHFDLDSRPTRAAGLDLRLGKVDYMTVDYDTDRDPVTVQMDVTNRADLLEPTDIAHATYVYASATDGRRQMTFDFSANIVPGPLVETTRVTSQWLDSGEGKATLTVTAGDAVGASELQCWGRGFAAVFTHKDWELLDLGMPASCADIALLDVPPL